MRPAKSIGNDFSWVGTPCCQVAGVSTIQADLENPVDVIRVADEAGEIDLLVNNAGVSSLASFLEQSLTEFDRYASPCLLSKVRQSSARSSLKSQSNLISLIGFSV